MKILCARENNAKDYYAKLFEMVFLGAKQTLQSSLSNRPYICMYVQYDSVYR